MASRLPILSHTRLASLICVAFLGPALMPGPSLAEQVEPKAVTFTKHVAPILQRSCESCHRTDGVAPMPLSTYEDVRPWARSIKLQTASRQMPPWFIEKGIGIQRFKDDPSLSEDEIATIATWVDGGAPRGNPADMPPPRQYADHDEWTIGTPDLIVSSPVMTVGARVPDWFGEVGPTPTGLSEDRYVQAVQFREVLVEEIGDDRRSEKQVAGLSYFRIHHSGLHEVDPTDDVVRTSSDGSGKGFYLVHELGANPTIYPDETGVLLKGGSSFIYTMHLHSTGQEARVRLDTGFTLHPKGWTPKYVQDGFVTMGLLKDELDLRGNSRVRVENYYRMPRPGILTTFEPHMHASGRRMCVEAIYPGGGGSRSGPPREMLNCAGYNHSWVKVYQYEEDVAPLLPAGTLVHVIGWYDNTPANPLVVDPRNWRGWGDRSVDDMFHFIPRVTWLTEEQYEAKVAEREKKQTSNN